MNKVFISILNYNNAEDTKECLESLDKIEAKGIELHLIVIDNASVEKLNIDSGKYSNLDIHTINNEENLGFSGGHNVGIRYGLENGADYILIMNNDILVDKVFLQELLKVAGANKDASIVVPKIYFAKGYEFHKDRYKENEKGRVIWYAGGQMDWENVLGHHRGVDEVDGGQYDEATKTSFATGACMLVSKKVFEEIGAFDERYFLYYEDYDLSIRARKKGFKIYFVPRASVWHKNASSAGGSGSSLQDYYITRNRLLFGTTYAPLRARLALLKESMKLLTHGRRPQRRGVKDFYLRRFGKENV